MTQLLTQCPFCQTTFKVSDAQMQVANGVVRCGACMEVFLAGQHRVILKERPFPAQRQAPEFEPGFQPSESHTREKHYPESLIGEDAPQWQVIDSYQDDLQETLQDESQENARSNDLFKSWEEEANYQPPGEAAITAPGSQEEDADADRVELIPSAELPEPNPEKTAYGAMLNPAGYAMTHFSVDHVLPSLQHTEGGGDDREDAAIEEVTKTAVIIRDKGDRIPTLEPDVVAKEAIPAAGIGAQTLAWIQSFRKSFRNSRADTGNVSGTDEKDEKAVLRSHLSALRDEDSLEPVTSAQLDVLDETPVEMLNIRQQWRRMKSATMAIASLGLVLVLAGQYLWFNLDSLVRDRRLSAVTGPLCRFQDCPDPRSINLAAVVTEELVVRSHPAVEDALQVDFIFRNDDNREQLFPLVELNFTDNAGAIVANRVFTTEEYLPPEMQLFTHMPAHSSIQVSLELMDPGAEATGYYLEFRNP